MFRHECSIEDEQIIGQRPNPLNARWSEWTLVVCSKCKRLQEWQHHSEEQMHGGDLEITANPTKDYLQHIYGLALSDIELILSGKKKVRRYNRYTASFEESYAQP